MNIPATKIIAKVESAVRKLDTEQADTVKRAVNNILQQAEPPESNITKEMRDALKSPKEGSIQWSNRVYCKRAHIPQTVVVQLFFLDRKPLPFFDFFPQDRNLSLMRCSHVDIQCGN